MNYAEIRVRGKPVFESITKKKLNRAFDMISKLDTLIESAIKKNDSAKVRHYLRSREVISEYIVAHNLDLVFDVAEDYRFAGKEYGHILCECNIGLIRSVDDYKPVSVLKFQTFAEMKIREYLLHYIFTHHCLDRFPSRLVRLLCDVVRIDADYFASNGQHPTISTIKSLFSEESKAIVAYFQANAGEVKLETVHLFLQPHYESSRIYIQKPLNLFIADSMAKLQPNVQSLLIELFGMNDQGAKSEKELEKKYSMYYADMEKIKNNFIGELENKIDRLIVIE